MPDRQFEDSMHDPGMLADFLGEHDDPREHIVRRAIGQTEYSNKGRYSLDIKGDRGSHGYLHHDNPNLEGTGFSPYHKVYGEYGNANSFYFMAVNPKMDSNPTDVLIHMVHRSRDNIFNHYTMWTPEEAKEIIDKLPEEHRKKATAWHDANFVHLKKPKE
jgi:hypothetical protein